MNPVRPSVDPAPGHTAVLARRMGWTEGQLYTMTIGLAVGIVLLALGLPATMGGGSRAEAAGESVTSVPAPPPTTIPSAPSTSPAPPSTASPGPSPVSPAPPPDAPPATPNSPDRVAEPPVSGNTPGPSSDERCPTTDDVRPVLDLLAQTGVVPDQSTTLILARITGCSQTDPTVLLLGALAELGSGLPDPGVVIPLVPLPFIEIPLDVVGAVQPLRDAIDPLCDAVGQVSQASFYAFGTWPVGIGPAVATPIRQVLLACGQLRPA